MEILPTLDLYNFTEPIAAESQYILTSPRSLEACARFGIKPVELLPKSSEEFEEDYGVHTENIATLYKKFEKERLRKLRLCRQERERIINENEPDDSEDDESICDEALVHDDDLLDTPVEGDDTLNHKKKDKPSILDYLDASSTYPVSVTGKDGRRGGTPFFRTSGALPSSNLYRKMDEGKRSRTVEQGNSQSYNNLSDSGSYIGEDVGVEKKRHNKVKRSQSFKLKGEVSKDSSPTLRKETRGSSPGLCKEDKKMLDQYLLRINTDQKLETEKDCPQCSNCDTKSGNKVKRNSSFSFADRKSKEGHLNHNHSHTSKENMESEASKWKTKYKKQVQKMDQKLNSIEKSRQFGQEIDSNVTVNKAPKKPQRSPSFRRSTTPLHDEQKYRVEHDVHFLELKEKHKRAGEEFQERMKQKLQMRELNKMKQLERKEFQERQLQAMENDLKLWQEELKNYQNICAERATRAVEKKNTRTSMKTHERRIQKEIEHAMLKSRVDEEERQRQEELKMLVNIKDARSRMIINAKAEYANAGRDCAQLSRSIRSRLQDKEVLSSFDKMASKGERMARLERMNSVKRDAPPKIRTQRKNQSMLHLG